MRLNDRVSSGRFAVEQGLRQGCVLAPLLFNIFFAVVINVAYTRFKADKDIMDALAHPRKKTGAGRRGEAAVRDPALATPLWGMLYADDVRIVSQSPEQSRKMMRVIVVVCTAFGLTLWEAKTEIMCLRTKGMPEATANQPVRGTIKRTSLYTSGGTSTTMPTCSSRRPRICNVWCSFRKHTRELYGRPSAPLELKTRMLRAEMLETMLYGCVTWRPRACHNGTLR